VQFRKLSFCEINEGPSGPVIALDVFKGPSPQADDYSTGR